MVNTDKLKELSENSRSSNWMELKAYKKENRKWIDRSMDIALRILDTLEQKGMSQTDLAQVLGVTRQYVSRIVRGTENLTLETISRIEHVLDIDLIKTVDEEEKVASTTAVQCKTEYDLDVPVHSSLVIFQSSRILLGNLSEKPEETCNWVSALSKAVGAHLIEVGMQSKQPPVRMQRIDLDFSRLGWLSSRQQFEHETTLNG
jgi:transcriptional regulator with XRE-family HTH domain